MLYIIDNSSLDEDEHTFFVETDIDKNILLQIMDITKLNKHQIMCEAQSIIWSNDYTAITLEEYVEDIEFDNCELELADITEIKKNCRERLLQNKIDSYKKDINAIQEFLKDSTNNEEAQNERLREVLKERQELASIYETKLKSIL